MTIQQKIFIGGLLLVCGGGLLILLVNRLKDTRNVTPPKHTGCKPKPKTYKINYSAPPPTKPKK